MPSRRSACRSLSSSSSSRSRASAASWSIGRGSRRSGTSASSGRCRPRKPLSSWPSSQSRPCFSGRARRWRRGSRGSGRLASAFDPALATVRRRPRPGEVVRICGFSVDVASAVLVVAPSSDCCRHGDARKWDLILRFTYQAPTGRSDPLSTRTSSLTLRLPSTSVQDLAAANLFLTSLMAGPTDLLHGDIDRNPRRGALSVAIAHGSAPSGVFFAVKAWSYALDRFLLLYDDNDVVVGRLRRRRCRAAGVPGRSSSSPPSPPLSLRQRAAA